MFDVSQFVADIIYYSNPTLVRIAFKIVKHPDTKSRIKSGVSGSFFIFIRAFARVIFYHSKVDGFEIMFK